VRTGDRGALPPEDDDSRLDAPNDALRPRPPAARGETPALADRAGDRSTRVLSDDGRVRGAELRVDLVRRRAGDGLERLRRGDSVHGADIAVQARAHHFEVLVTRRFRRGASGFRVGYA